MINSDKGQKWKTCMSCLQNSTFVNGHENDQSWFLCKRFASPTMPTLTWGAAGLMSITNAQHLDNMRYAVSACLFSFPNATGLGSTPCSTSTACGQLEDAFENGVVRPESSTQYAYCDASGGGMTGPIIPKCLACVATGDTKFLANCKELPPIYIPPSSCPS